MFRYREPFPLLETFRFPNKAMHYESAPCFEGKHWLPAEASRGFAPAPQDLALLRLSR